MFAMEFYLITKVLEEKHCNQKITRGLVNINYGLENCYI